MHAQSFIGLRTHTKPCLHTCKPGVHIIATFAIEHFLSQRSRSLRCCDRWAHRFHTIVLIAEFFLNYSDRSDRCDYMDTRLYSHVTNDTDNNDTPHRTYYACLTMLAVHTFKACLYKHRNSFCYRNKINATWVTFKKHRRIITDAIVNLDPLMHLQAFPSLK